MMIYMKMHFVLMYNIIEQIIVPSELTSQNLVHTYYFFVFLGVCLLLVFKVLLCILK